MTSSILAKTINSEFPTIMFISFCVAASSDNYSVQVVYFISTTVYKILRHLHTLNMRLDLVLVISFCVAASSDNYSVQAIQPYPSPRLNF